MSGKKTLLYPEELYQNFEPTLVHKPFNGFQNLKSFYLFSFWFDEKLNALFCSIFRPSIINFYPISTGEEPWIIHGGKLC